MLHIHVFVWVHLHIHIHLHVHRHMRIHKYIVLYCFQSVFPSVKKYELMKLSYSMFVFVLYSIFSFMLCFVRVVYILRFYMALRYII